MILLMAFMIITLIIGPRDTLMALYYYPHHWVNGTLMALYYYPHHCANDTLMAIILLPSLLGQ